MWTPDSEVIITAEEKEAEERTKLELKFSSLIQNHMDTTARQRRYDSIQSAISYRDDPNPQFAAEANALFSWRSAVWTYATTELDKVASGERGIPTIEDFLQELPSLTWPEDQE